MNSNLLLSQDVKYFTSDQLKRLDGCKIPTHIAIIMDGNRRWAKKSAQETNEGHQSGADILIDVLKAAQELGIKYVTLFVFSTENWTRSADEVQALLWLFETYIRKQTPEMVEQQIRFATIGDTSRFPEGVLNAIDEAKKATEYCEAMEVIFAMNYGARDELKRSIKKMVTDCLENKITPSMITEKSISQYLDTASYPDPDLLIRTGGEYRVSNFLLWQLSYSEIYVTKTFWPDFTPFELYQGILEYQHRERRRGQ